MNLCQQKSPWLLADMNSLQWRHNERDGVSNHRRIDCHDVYNARMAETYLATANYACSLPSAEEHPFDIARQLGPSTLAVPEQLSNGGGKNVGYSSAESGTDFWALCTTSATLWPL